MINPWRVLKLLALIIALFGTFIALCYFGFVSKFDEIERKEAERRERERIELEDRLKRKEIERRAQPQGCAIYKRGQASRRHPV